MHKLIEYVCDELEALEKKAEKGGSLSASEIQYADTLAHLKKNLLKSEEMMDEDGYSSRYVMDDGRVSYERGRRGNVRRDSMGRYSRDSRDGGYSRTSGDMVEELRDLMEDAPNEQTRREIEKLIRKMEQM